MTFLARKAIKTRKGSRFLVLIMAGLAVAGLSAQTSPASSSLKGMSFNGATGLYSIPTGRIGWERTSNLGLDLGYHTVFAHKKAGHIPKVGLSLFKWVELSGAFDIQPKNVYTYDNGTDFIGGMKVQLPFSKTAVAIGGNIQALNLGKNTARYNAGQVYLAITYAGEFFSMPAETTVVLGKTFIEDRTDSDIDFGMGFDLILLPKIFQNYIHWVTDFSNFSYSIEPIGAYSAYRGVLNSGIR
ncbi:MAG: hypothetical protein LBQ67_03655, partial [Treponema sp.]|nr:hypothetical protein [Treponema sp.]